MIADIIIIVIIAIFTVLGAMRGFLRTLLNLAAMALNLFLSNFVGGALAGTVYRTWIQPVILQNLEAEILKNGFSDTMAHSLQSVPQWLHSLLASVFTPMGISMDELQKGVLISKDQAQTIAKTIEQPLGSVITAVLGMVITVVLFLLLTLIVKLILHAALRRLRGVPIGGMNHLFGGIFGLLEGIIFVCIAINIFYVIMTYASPSFFENAQNFGTIFRALCVYI